MNQIMVIHLHRLAAAHNTNTTGSISNAILLHNQLVSALHKQAPHKQPETDVCKKEKFFTHTQRIECKSFAPNGYHGSAMKHNDCGKKRRVLKGWPRLKSHIYDKRRTACESRKRVQNNHFDFVYFWHCRKKRCEKLNTIPLLVAFLFRAQVGFSSGRNSSINKYNNNKTVDKWTDLFGKWQKK